MKKSPHFFKIYTRLGALYQLIRQSHDIGGVENAPDFILTPEFLNLFPAAPVSEYSFSSPEKINPENYFSTLAKEFKELSTLINQQLKTDETQICIGGDNTLTVASLMAVLKRLDNPKQLGYIQFDSHGEMHLYDSSVSKNFHGMYMRPFLEKFDIPEIDELAPQKLDLSQLFTIGDIIFDEGDNHPHGEVELYKNIRNLSQAEFRSDRAKALQEFRDFTAKFQHLHVNFDIDVFDSSVAGATGEDEGVWLWDEIEPFLKIIAQHSHISVDLVEINPHMDSSERSIKLGQQILELLLS